MIFEIGFNKKDIKDNKSFYEFIGATQIHNKDCYEIEINSLEDLKELMQKINLELKSNYSAIVDFDNWCTIYLDNDC